MENAGSGKNDSVWAICVHYLVCFFVITNQPQARRARSFRNGYSLLFWCHSLVGWFRDWSAASARVTLSRVDW